MMKRDGFESDVSELHVYDIESKTITKVNSTFKESVRSIVWSEDNETIYFTGGWQGHVGVYQISLTKSEAIQLTTKEFDYQDLSILNGRLYCVRSSTTSPQDICFIDTQTKSVTQITFENKHIFDHIKSVKYEERWVNSSVDDKKIHTYVVYPPDFDSSKKYPTVLFCTGGPQSMNANTWRYRWNLMLIASKKFK